MGRLFAFGVLFVAATAWGQVPAPERPVEISIGSGQTLVFRRVSPAAHQLDYPDIFVLETEVTNAQFKAYLDATGGTKDDSEVLRILAERKKSGVISTGDTPYSIEDETTIWWKGRYPERLDDHPVALVTLDEAAAFGDWLSRKHEGAGLFRLPTWNEWMVAAYGRTRNYPWGAEWDAKRAHTSYGLRYHSSFDKPDEPDWIPKRTEPVKERPGGRSPEGIYGLIGNVGEYLHPGDPKSEAYFNCGSQFLGGGFQDGLVFFDDKTETLAPRNDYWGYFHETTGRECDLGFRLVLDPKKNADLLNRPPLFRQTNESWMIEGEEEVPADSPAKPSAPPKR